MAKLLSLDEFLDVIRDGKQPQESMHQYAQRVGVRYRLLSRILLRQRWPTDITANRFGYERVYAYRKIEKPAVAFEIVRSTGGRKQGKWTVMDNTARRGVFFSYDEAECERELQRLLDGGTPQPIAW